MPSERRDRPRVLPCCLSRHLLPPPLEVHQLVVLNRGSRDDAASSVDSESQGYQVLPTSAAPAQHIGWAPSIVFLPHLTAVAAVTAVTLLLYPSPPSPSALLIPAPPAWPALQSVHSASGSARQSSCCAPRCWTPRPAAGPPSPRTSPGGRGQEGYLGHGNFTRL